MNKLTKITTAILIVFVTIMLVSNTGKYTKCFVDGVSIWAYNVLPVLLPFAIFSKFVPQILPSNGKSLTSKLFNINCDTAFFTSLICGYPVGAKAVADQNFDDQSKLSALAFCSTPSPIFIVATVGYSLLNSTTATIVILLSQIFSAVINGIIYRPKTKNNSTNVACQINCNFATSLTDSTLSVLNVGALIALFYTFTQMIIDVVPQNISSNNYFYFLIGLLEMTNGIILLCHNTNLLNATVLCSTLLAFGGICVCLQCLSFVSSAKINIKSLIKMKITQSAICTVITFILAKIFCI